MINLENFELKDLKKLNINELEELASNIRENIIYHVSKNGGHLASNLGVVELTIAMHYVFDSPFDKLIFDVSHQSYTHKILTGRSLENLRTINGVSGFTKYSESIHDAFEAGHSSTSIAAGYGFVLARMHGANIGEVVTLIGDASITNGLSFEGLNIVGSTSTNPKSKMIIIVNDNEMSISKNVGALAKAFNRVQIGKGYKFLKKITPKFVHKVAHKVSKSIRGYIYQDKFFSSLGFSYIYGIDGHNIKELIKYLEYAKRQNKSVVLHVKTIKGKGYEFAERDNIGLWHSVSPFDISTGAVVASNKVTSGDVIGRFIANKKNEFTKIHLITPATSLGSGLDDFIKLYPNDFTDVGIAEESAVVIASALSLNGFVPYVFIYSSFLQRTYDQIIHDGARANQHIVFCVDRSGIVGGDGDTHQGIYDLAFLKTIPNVHIFQAKSKSDLENLITYTYNTKQISIIRYAKYTSLLEFSDFDPCKWQIITKGTTKITIISYGSFLIDVYNYLNKTNNDKITLIDAHMLWPLDNEMLDLLKANNSQIYVYEDVINNNSLADSIINYYDGKYHIEYLNLPNDYLQSATVEQIKKIYKITVEDLFAKIKG